jgi:hypothetical protein
VGLREIGGICCTVDTRIARGGAGDGLVAANSHPGERGSGNSRKTKLLTRAQSVRRSSESGHTILSNACKGQGTRTGSPSRRSLRRRVRTLLARRAAGLTHRLEEGRVVVEPSWPGNGPPRLDRAAALLLVAIGGTPYLALVELSLLRSREARSRTARPRIYSRPSARRALPSTVPTPMDRSPRPRGSLGQRSHGGMDHARAAVPEKSRPAASRARAGYGELLRMTFPGIGVH